MKKKYYLFKMNSMILNIISIIIFIVMCTITYLIYKEKIYDMVGLSMTISVLLMIPYLLLHELVHSFSYVIHGANFKNITYGIHLDKGIMCCLCKQNITKKNILFSLLYPFVTIGVITYILGIVLNNHILIILSIINISGCSGDLIMFYDLLKINNFEYSEYDDPMAFGLYSSNDLSSLKLIGLEYVGEEQQLEKNDLKKVSINKISIVMLIIFFAFAIINILVNK